MPSNGPVEPPELWNWSQDASPDSSGSSEARRKRQGVRHSSNLSDARSTTKGVGPWHGR
jgi:hypothetical protein